MFKGSDVVRLLLLRMYVLQYSEEEFHGANKPLNPFHFIRSFLFRSGFFFPIIETVNFTVKPKRFVERCKCIAFSGHLNT